MENEKKGLKKLNRRRKKISSFFGNIFQKFFSFESGIDISNDTQVLFRRNKVIKNIILVTNLLYTIILFIVSHGDSKNIVLSALLLPVTFFVNRSLTKMINQNETNILKQQIAMYVQCFYMFLSATLVYIKLKSQLNSNSEVVMYAEVGYAMLYVSLVVVSLYQDKKLLAEMSKWLLLLVTILHFTVTYKFVELDGYKDAWTAVSDIIQSDAFKDIVLRTAVLGLFAIALYVNVAISEFLMEQRKTELLKRKEVEDEFTSVVIDMYNANFNDMYINDQTKAEADLLAKMSFQLASYLGLKPDECEDIKKYSRIYLDNIINLEEIKSIPNKDDRFEMLRNETQIGSVIARRLSLKRKTDNIVRVHVQGGTSPEYIDFMKMVKEPVKDQIVAICDIYISLRSFRDYKRRYDQNMTVKALTNDYKQYFDNIVFERFMNFINVFKDMYDEYGG